MVWEKTICYPALRVWLREQAPCWDFVVNGKRNEKNEETIKSYPKLDPVEMLVSVAGGVHGEEFGGCLLESVKRKAGTSIQRRMVKN